MTVNFKIDLSQVKQKARDLANIKATVMPKAFKEFVKNTPVLTGNAQMNTQFVNNEIHASYPYAFVLDAGRGFRDGQMRGSVQAPNGMSQPTELFIKQEVTKEVRKIRSK
jgi:hypothetical protein